MKTDEEVIFIPHYSTEERNKKEKKREKKEESKKEGKAPGAGVQNIE